MADLEHPPMAVKACPVCGGEGATYESPSRPIPDDPDFEVAVPCPECGAAGLIEADPAEPRCTNPAGHVWVISDEDDRSYCEQCGADGDA